MQFWIRFALPITSAVTLEKFLDGRRKRGDITQKRTQLEFLILNNQRGLHAAEVLCMYAYRTDSTLGSQLEYHELVRYPDTRQQRPRVPVYVTSTVR